MSEPSSSRPVIPPHRGNLTRLPPNPYRDMSNLPAYPGTVPKTPATGLNLQAPPGSSAGSAIVRVGASDWLPSSQALLESSSTPGSTSSIVPSSVVRNGGGIWRNLPALGRLGRALGGIGTLNNLYEGLRDLKGGNDAFRIIANANMQGRDLTEAERAEVRRLANDTAFSRTAASIQNFFEMLLSRGGEVGNDPSGSTGGGGGGGGGGAGGGGGSSRGSPGGSQAATKPGISNLSGSPGGSPGGGSLGGAAGGSPGGSPGGGSRGGGSPGGGSLGGAAGGSPGGSPGGGSLGGSPGGGSLGGSPGGGSRGGGSPGGGSLGGSPGGSPGGFASPLTPPGSPGGGSLGGGSLGGKPLELAYYKITIDYQWGGKTLSNGDEVFNLKYPGSLVKEVKDTGASITLTGNTIETFPVVRHSYYYLYRNSATAPLSKYLLIYIDEPIWEFKNGDIVLIPPKISAGIRSTVPVYANGSEAGTSANPGSKAGGSSSSAPGGSPGSPPGGSPGSPPAPGSAGTGPASGYSPGSSPGTGGSTSPGGASSGAAAPSPGGSPGSSNKPGSGAAPSPGGSPAGGSAPGGGSSPGTTGGFQFPGMFQPGGSQLPMPLFKPAPPAPNGSAAPSGGNSPGGSTLTQTQPAPTGGGSAGTGEPPQIKNCSYDSLNISGGVGEANAKLDKLDLTLQAIQTIYLAKIDSTTGTINDKLGDKIPNGGIGGLLKKTSDLIGKTWDFLQVDRVLNVLTWIGVLHNGYMLSNNLAQTLFSAISMSLDVFGIEDKEGNALDVGKIVSGWTDGFFKRIFGVSTVEGIKAEWKKWNRIYQAASNMLFTVQSMMYSMLDSLEVVGNYVARIGNAAKIFGLFAENAYKWMNPNLNFTTNRFFNALNNTQEAVENIEEIASSVKEIQDLGEELYNNKSTLEKAIDDLEKSEDTAKTAVKTASQTPNIPTSAESKPEA